MSLGVWRQRVKPKLASPHGFRRGNVPKYISFVEPMPVHLRPGTGTSSGYGSSGISMVSEDLLVSAGTQEEELADSGEESESELDSRYGILSLRDELGPRTADVDDASQEAMMSSRSSLNRSELEESCLDGEISGNMDTEGAEDNMPSSEGQDKQDAVEEQYNELDDLSRIGHSMESDIALLDKAFGGGEYDQGIGEDDIDSNELGESLETNGDRDWHLSNAGSVDGTYSGLGEGFGDDRNNSSLGDAEQQQQVLGDGEKTFDFETNKDDIPEDQLDSSENTPQVSFSEPLATSPHSFTNDTENGSRTEPAKSILKGTSGDKNRIFEHELDPSIMRRMTSPRGTEKTADKPVIARRSADLRSQSKPDILIADHDTEAQSEKKQSTDDDEMEPAHWKELASSDDEWPSDSDLHSSTGTRRRRPKPKKNIYGERANLKPPSEKLRKRKDSNGSDDVIMSAESTLLMEQIMEEEKRLREGMKPWLKGRLALSQQNSRFEIPMDVRLLETMTPMEYLTKYCVISKRRKALYQHVFQKVDRNRDGMINFTELEKGLTDVHTGILDSEHVENIVEMVLIDRDDDFNLKQFSAIAAFSERISCKDQLPVEMLNNLDGQKEVIECADFFALSWKLDGIKVNSDVKRILDSL